MTSRDSPRSILERKARKLGARFRADLYDECVAYLFEVAWRAYESWDPERGPWKQRLRWKLDAGVVDFYRRELGRTRWQFRDYVHERGRPDVLSLDAPVEGNQLADTLPSRESHDEIDRSPSLERLLARRDRERVGDFAELGLEVPRRARS
jgi:hypothetical protein